MNWLLAIFVVRKDLAQVVKGELHGLSVVD
jgi:hypothetical protein